jgi:hypothetical protein
MDYAEEKLYDIIKYLATAKGDMRERLNVMAVDIDLVSQDNFPDDLKSKWEFVEEKLHKHPPKFNWNRTRQEMGSIEHSLSRMQNRTACIIAEVLFELWEELRVRNHQSV